MAKAIDERAYTSRCSTEARVPPCGRQGTGGQAGLPAENESGYRGERGYKRSYRTSPRAFSWGTAGTRCCHRAGTGDTGPKRSSSARTFLKGLIHIGEYNEKCGRLGDFSSRAFRFAEGAGIPGAPFEDGDAAARQRGLHRLFRCQIQNPDEVPSPFSFETEMIDRPQVRAGSLPHRDDPLNHS
jgi:hypothetical protein